MSWLDEYLAPESSAPSPRAPVVAPLTDSARVNEDALYTTRGPRGGLQAEGLNKPDNTHPQHKQIPALLSSS